MTPFSRKKKHVGIEYETCTNRKTLYILVMYGCTLLNLTMNRSYNFVRDDSLDLLETDIGVRGDCAYDLKSGV